MSVHTFTRLAFPNRTLSKSNRGEKEIKTLIKDTSPYDVASIPTMKVVPYIAVFSLDSMTLLVPHPDKVQQSYALK